MSLRRIAAYLFFGVLTTVVNIAVYALFARVLHVHYIVANLIAWVAAVAFAFITNKLWVFDSPSFDRDVVLYEAGTFTASRLASGAMDMGMMLVLVGMVGMSDVWAKVIVNVLVVIANYVLSRVVVFRRTTA
jgi:putative flippase GtrA